MGFIFGLFVTKVSRGVLLSSFSFMVYIDFIELAYRNLKGLLNVGDDEKGLQQPSPALVYNIDKYSI